MFCQWFNPLEHLSASSKVNSYHVHSLIHEGTQSTQGKTVSFFNQRLCQWFNPLEQQHSTKAKLKNMMLALSNICLQVR